MGGIADVERPTAIRALIPQGPSAIARGLGRSYGDAALNTGGRVWLTERLNRILAFDPTTGILQAESGVTLSDVIALGLPHGWFPYVTPGTRHATLGGCIAADVHGKNHHREGGFGEYVEQFTLVLADGKRCACSRTEQAPLFWSTIGGMGLTGFIRDVTIRLRRIETPVIVRQHLPARDLAEMFRYFETPEFDDVYTVAWIDALADEKSLGRGVFMKGHHAARTETPPDRQSLAWQPTAAWTVPFNAPTWLMNPTTIGAFNRLYAWSQARTTAPTFSTLDAFFYPLDRLTQWPRLYGRPGFLQYQCVLPTATAPTALPDILRLFARHRCPSFLAVLKRMGPEGQGLLSFPREGYTLALDIPAKDPSLLPLLERVDEVVVKYAGRVYLAKDCRLKAATFQAMYPRWETWRSVQHMIDPEHRFQSDLSRRLQLTAV